MDDLIPFLIILLISVVGAIGSRKKKRNAGENIAEPQHKAFEEDIFNWLDKLKINEEEESFPFITPEQDNKPMVAEEKAVIHEPVKHAAPIPGIYDKYSGFITNQEREDIMAKEGVSAINKNNISDGDLTKQNINSDIENQKRNKIELDMRKAVIYSEIYNRKYI